MFCLTRNGVIIYNVAILQGLDTRPIMKEEEKNSFISAKGVKAGPPAKRRWKNKVGSKEKKMFLILKGRKKKTHFLRVWVVSYDHDTV